MHAGDAAPPDAPATATGPAGGTAPGTGGGLAEPAPAKLNLTLHVVGRRSDGFHLLDGLVAFTALGDRVAVRSRPTGAGLALRLTGPFARALEAEPDNLVVRAAEALAEALRRPGDLELTLEKTLPVASGIGGGSADAAATLRAVARLWEVPLDHPALVRTAAGLGADVPMCLARRTAWITGTGTVDAPGPELTGIPVVLVNPGVPLSTPEVFRARHGRFSVPDRFVLADTAAPQALAAALAPRRNDLTDAAIRLVPAIAAVLEALGATPGCLLARMSGSGATCFGLFETAAEADAAAAAVAAAKPAWWVRATALL